MRDIKRIPVFSKFDKLHPVRYIRPALPQGLNHRHPANPCEVAFYAIRVKKMDPILFPHEYDFVPFSVLQYATEQGIDVEILGQVVPHKVVNVNPADVLKRMYDSDLQDCDKKYVANLVYGLAGRKYNKSSFGQLYQDEKEAKSYSMNKMIVKLAPDLHLVIEQLKRTLSEGYRPVAHMILNGMRVLLHRIVKALGKEHAIGVRTDCIYTGLSEDEAAKRLSEFRFKQPAVDQSSALMGGGAVPHTQSHYDNIGSLRFERGKVPDMGMSVCSIEHEPPTQRAFDQQKQLRMKDEYDIDEAEEILDEGTPLLVVGKYPGTGKSKMALDWGAGRDLELLVVCPTNALCDELKKQGHENVITTHMLIGKRPNAVDAQGQDESFKPFDVSKYSAVLFEEVFFYPVYQLEWIAGFMKQHANKDFIANGDPAQNEPVGQVLNMNFDDYYNEALAQMFPRRLNLMISKRYNAEDRERIEMLYNELLSPGNQRPFDIASKYLNVIDWADLKRDEDAAFHPHIAFTNDSVDRVNTWAQICHCAVSGHQRDPDKWRVGDVVVGRTYGRVAKKRKINSNAVYTIKQISGTHLVIEGKDEIERELTIASAPKFLRRPWCRTGHSIQGQTIGNKLYIHDAETSMATARWLRTAITRCRTLDITLVKYKDPMRVPKWLIEKRIKHHIQADKYKGRIDTLPDDYVSVDWAREKVKMQGYSCAMCSEPLDKDWSIDRIDNARAHIKDNCQISCRRCQHASSHR